MLLTVGVSMELLKPCIKCGQSPIAGPAAVGTDVQLWTIVCPGCGEQTESFASIEAAAETWNRRPDRGADRDTPFSGEEADEPALSDGLGEPVAVPA